MRLLGARSSNQPRFGADAYGGPERLSIRLVVQRFQRWLHLFIAARLPASKCRVGPRTMARRMGRKLTRENVTLRGYKVYFVNPQRGTVLGVMRNSQAQCRLAVTDWIGAGRRRML